MTDKEQFIAMLTRAGIEFEDRTDKISEPTLVTIVVERGYCGFYTNFKFQRDSGALVDIGAFE